MVYLGFFALCLQPVSCAVSEQVTAEDAESDMAEAKVKTDKNNSFAKEMQTKQQTVVEQLDLPEDTSSRFGIKQLRISGNTLISTDKLLEDLPLVYNASDKPLQEACRRLNQVIFTTLEYCTI
jgi:hemolysin activation/secretion protein